MGKIISTIGKVLVFCVIIIAQICCGQGTIDISMRDTRGRKVTQVVVGQPFMLYITMHDIDGSNARVSIERPRNIPLQRTSVQMRSVNGKASTTHIYTGRIDDRGICTLGPVMVDDGKQRYEANAIRIEAVDAPLNAQSKHNEYVMLRLIPSKMQAYAGETISFNLRFYFPHDGIRAERLIQPPIPHSTQSAITGPFAGSETIDNVVHEYSEWRWDVVFNQEGMHAIPSYIMEYTDHHSQPASRFGFFSSFFNDFGKKQISASPVNIRIDSVPSHPQASGFIGTAHQFVATLDRNSTVVGQPVVLTLELVSSHNAASLQPPLLQDLPRAIKYYQSKVDTIHDEQVTRTRFEYVLQPLEAGEWEIPSQPYIYFDVSHQEYYVIQTDPLYLSVDRGSQVATQSTHDTHQKQDEYADEQHHEDSLKPLHEMGPWSPEHVRGVIPWWMFWVLLTMPVWCTPLLYSFKKWQRYRDDTLTDRRARHAYAYARASLKRIQHGGSVQDIMHMFKQVCADVWRMPLHEITESYMRDTLKKKMPVDLYGEWNQFWMQLLEGVYAQRLYDHTSFQHVCNQAQRWLDRLSAWL